MSTIRVTNIGDIAGGTVSNASDGIAKAWQNLNGTGTIAERASLNISSTTDVRNGEYQPNFSNDMADANYSIFALNSCLYSAGSMRSCEISEDNVPGVGAFNIFSTYQSNGSGRVTQDQVFVNTQVMGDLV